MNLLQVGKIAGALWCRRKYLRIFAGGFDDETYIVWERSYRWTAHEGWDELLRRKQFGEIAARALRRESWTNLLSPLKKWDPGCSSIPGRARQFAEGLYDFIYEPGDHAKKFQRWCQQP